MVQTAESNGIGWDAAFQWIRGEGPWDDEVLQGVQGASAKTTQPDYYRKPFHAYESGNLNWEAAFEQELASRAVGARNFPLHGKDGEEAFRGAFDRALSSVGASVPSDGLVVDLGCGTGASTRRLAARFPQAARILGIDMSPYFVAVGRRLLERAPGPAEPWVATVQSDPRVELHLGDAAHTQLPDACASVVSLFLVIHELPPDVTRSVCAEAFRVLRPGGQLWISEMDFRAPAYAELRANALLFSLIRATEPYLDLYADSSEQLFQHLATDIGFQSVRIAAATGRHFALVATKHGSGRGSEGVIDDRRFDAEGNYAVEDTHLKTWESKSSDA